MWLKDSNNEVVCKVFCGRDEDWYFDSVWFKKGFGK